MQHEGSCSTLTKIMVTMLKKSVSSCKRALSNSIIVLIVAVAASMEINRSHYFQSDRCICKGIYLGERELFPNLKTKRNDKCETDNNTVTEWYSVAEYFNHKTQCLWPFPFKGISFM